MQRFPNILQKSIVEIFLLLLSMTEIIGHGCLNNPCMYGVCVDKSNSSYSCYCIDGYTGINCEVNWDDCWSDPCLNGGTCKDAIATYNCTCASGYVGFNCEQEYNKCMDYPCYNGGTCIDSDELVICKCPIGFLGDHCEIDESVCNDTICKNNGTCFEGSGFSFVCECAEGWRGQFCEEDINECLEPPCQNGGLCINLPSTYTCACLFGFSGKNCEKTHSHCLSSPCKNEAICLKEDSEMTCYCVPDYHSTFCELKYNDCEANFVICQNGGICLDGVNNFSCSCPPEYSGKFCETSIGTSTSEPTSVTFDVGTWTPSTVPEVSEVSSTEFKPTTNAQLPGMTFETTSYPNWTLTEPTENTISTILSTDQFSQTSTEVSLKTTIPDKSASKLNTLQIPINTTQIGNEDSSFVESLPTIANWLTSTEITQETSTDDLTELTSPFVWTTTSGSDATTVKGYTGNWTFQGSTTISYSEMFTEENTTWVSMTDRVSGFTREMTESGTISEDSTIIGLDIHKCEKEECSDTTLCLHNFTECDCSFPDNCIKTFKAAFNGKSYIRQEISLDDGNLGIVLRLKTKIKNGVIVHALFDDERFASLYLDMGQLKSQFSCGFQTMLFGEVDSPINNGYFVDIELSFQYIVEEKTDKCVAKLLVNDSMVMNGEQILQMHGHVPRHARLHFGGIPTTTQHFPQTALGFIGCMSFLKVNNERKHFIADSTETFQVSECHSFMCYSNPCKNFGACQEIDGKVRCNCNSGYWGEYCEKSACDNNPCRLGATCSTIAGGSYICLCPLGMHGLFCEQEYVINKPAFSILSPGFSSYVAYGIEKSIKNNMELKIRFIPHTQEQISLLAYIGQTASRRDVSDYFSITYVRGYIMLTWDLGSGVRRIFTQSPLKITSRKSHTVIAGRRGRDAWLYVEEIGNVTGRSKGTMTDLDVSSILYIGGHRSKYFETLPHDLPLHTGFVGCIFEVVLRTGNDVFSVSQTSPATGRGVGECHYNECSNNACKNGAVCISHGPTYSCICMKDWEGPDCSRNNCDLMESKCHLNERQR